MISLRRTLGNDAPIGARRQSYLRIILRIDNAVHKGNSDNVQCKRKENRDAA